jgi:hypothetical protein
MQSGLWWKGGSIPLLNVAVNGRLRDFTAEVEVSQTYVHHEKNAIEATFKFPLDIFGALCGFEVVVDGKQYIAQVKSREEGRHLSAEEVAPVGPPSLRDEDQPDLFLCNIGHLPPGLCESCEIFKIYTQSVRNF